MSLLRRLRYRAMHAGSRVERAAWKRSLLRNRLKYLSRTVAFDGVPTMRGLALLLEYARRHGWKGRLNSSDRRRGVAERYGKRSQAALYAGFLAGLPGFLPANPPGRSSHELRSDGNPFFGKPAGAPLPWYQLGLDVDDDARLEQILKAKGVDIHHPYRAASEAHHLNVATDPTHALVRLGLA